MAVFITGGARSGKSDFAERYAMKLAPRGIYIATSQIWDEEMAERIERHKRGRGTSGYPWRTVEEPFELAALLRRLEKETAGEDGRPAVLVDCLTLWLTNLMLKLDAETESRSGLEGHDGSEGANGPDADDRIAAVTDDLIGAVADYSGPLLLVSNEVGSGIVPAYPLGRRFRDEAGRLNRRLAAVCGQAFLVVAGFPLDLQAHAFRLEDR